MKIRPDIIVLIVGMTLMWLMGYMAGRIDGQAKEVKVEEVQP